jgi:cytochrome c556
MRTAAAVIASLVALAACAAVKPTTPEIQARQELMRSNKAALIELGKITSGEAPWNAEAAQRQATTLASNAVMIPAKTEKGTGGESGRTRARPEIWEEKNWDAFLIAAENLEDQARGILNLARANNEAGVRARVAMLEKDCDACHKRFMFSEFPR